MAINTYLLTYLLGVFMLALYNATTTSTMAVPHNNQLLLCK